MINKIQLSYYAIFDCDESGIDVLSSVIEF